VPAIVAVQRHRVPTDAVVFNESHNSPMTKQGRKIGSGVSLVVRAYREEAQNMRKEVYSEGRRTQGSSVSKLYTQLMPVHEVTCPYCETERAPHHSPSRFLCSHCIA